VLSRALLVDDIRAGVAELQRDEAVTLSKAQALELLTDRGPG
jgi:hypothetical protein